MAYVPSYYCSYELGCIGTLLLLFGALCSRYVSFRSFGSTSRCVLGADFYRVCYDVLLYVEAAEEGFG